MASDSIRTCAVCLLLVLSGCRTLHNGGESGNLSLSEEDVSFAQALAHFGQGLLYEEELGRDSEKAREHFEIAADLDPDAHRLAVKSALVAIRQAQPDKAIASLKASCEANPGSLQAWVDLAVTCQVAGRLELAEKYYRRAIKTEPDRVAVYLTLSTLLFTQDKDPEAIEILRAGVRNVSDSGSLIARCYAHASQLVHRKKLARALPCIEFVAQNAPGARQRFYHLLGEMYLELGNEKQGLRNLRKATKGDTPSANAYRRLARIHMGKDRSRAIRILKDASRRLPGDVHILLDLESAFRKDGQFEKAVTALDAASKIFEESKEEKVKHEFYLHYGSVCEQAGRSEQAKRIFQRCVELYPNSHQALNYLAYMWAEAGDNLDKAQEYVIRALSHEPKNGAYIDTLGWIYYRQGKYSLAREKIQEALELMKDDPTITDHMGDALAALGNVDRAIPYWKKSFRIDPTNEAVEAKLRRHGVDLGQLREDTGNSDRTSD